MEKRQFSIPYVQGISDKFKNVINGDVHRTAFFSLNKLNKFVKIYKDLMLKKQKRNVVYKINCNSDASYVDQMKRKLIIRVTEHKLNLCKGPNSVNTEHALHHSHKIDWKNTKIKERYFNKRLISEIININIKRQTNGLNFQKDRWFKSYI